MAETPIRPRGLAVPSGRLSRLARFGGLAASVGGGMLADAARQVAEGRRPSLGDLLLTPANARKVADQLAHLRGAAMKVGQLMSMDAGDVLPPELTEILARLRSDARPMPVRQLEDVLNRRWGRDWRRRFARFETAPIAAASIGQVHRATTRDGRDLAIKIQYPGVRASIDSDVTNVAALLRLSGLLPRELDLGPLLAEARRQLHEEADYGREAAQLARFGALLADAPDYRVPGLHADFCTPDVLAMDHVAGDPVEALADAPQAERDRIATLLVDLLLRELFEFGLMQTDPNFANYRYDRATGRLVLLDFGAARAFGPDLVAAYRGLLRAGLAGEADATRAAAATLGFFDADTAPAHQDAVMGLVELALEPLRRPGGFDFADAALPAQLRAAGLALAEERDFWRIPPVDTLFVQRKVAGVYLLATRLKARVDVRGLLERRL